MARGPDNFGFVGALVGIVSHKKRFAKYAGQWGYYDGESTAYRFQRWFYQSKIWNSPVFANTTPSEKTPKVVSLLNASLSESDWCLAGEMIQARQTSQPFRLLFVGRISPAKGIDTLLYAISNVVKSNLPIHLDIVGDGAERLKAENLAEQLGLQSYVTFHGWQDRDSLFRFYSHANCLVSASRHQGLDKVILEGMAFALPIVGTEVSVMPFLINPPECGVLVESDSVDNLATAIKEIVEQPFLLKQMGENARKKSADFLLEKQEGKFRVMLREQLGLQV
jgi:glycosyltransferase involved in cell wall biosynthesis